MTQKQEAAFDAVVKACAEAFAMRKPYARERATILRDKYLQQVVCCRSITDGPPCSRCTTPLYRAATIQDVLHKNRNKRLHPDDRGPTPESRLKPGPQDTLAMLLENGTLTQSHVSAAEHILAIYMAVIKSLMPKCSGIEPGRDGSLRQGEGMPEWAARQHHDVYRPWCAALLKRGKGELSVVLDIVVGGMSIRECKARYRKHHKTIVQCLRSGLDLYIFFAKDTA